MKKIKKKTITKTTKYKISLSTTKATYPSIWLEVTNK